MHSTGGENAHAGAANTKRMNFSGTEYGFHLVDETGIIGDRHIGLDCARKSPAMDPADGFGTDKAGNGQGQKNALVVRGGDG